MTRVGVIGPQSPDSFADNIADCLPDLDVEVVRLGSPRPRFKRQRYSAAYDFAARAFPGVDAKVQERTLVQRAIEAECDLIVSTQSEMLPSTLSAIRASGTPVVLWFPDHIANLGRGLMFSGEFDTVYFKDPEVVDRARRLFDLSVAYLPEACNPHWHKPPADVSPGDDPSMTLVANLNPTRAILLEHLAADAVPLRVFGPSAPSWLPIGPGVAAAHQGSSLFREEKARAFREATAVMNNLNPSEMGSVNCRLFEAAGSGAALITEYRPALDDLFDIGTEVLAFSTYDELIGHWERLTKDPAEAVRLGDAAARRAREEHTYQHRLRVILDDQVK